jgi:hypothetical protein
MKCQPILHPNEPQQYIPLASPANEHQYPVCDFSGSMDTTTFGSEPNRYTFDPASLIVSNQFEQEWIPLPHFDDHDEQPIIVPEPELAKEPEFPQRQPEVPQQVPEFNRSIIQHSSNKLSNSKPTCS